MPSAIDFREIPVFAFLETEARKELMVAFQRQVHEHGETIVRHGGSVPGIFIIVEGEVEVRLPQTPTPIAKLSRGQCFGEMSLLEYEVHAASADVTVSSDSLKALFCSVSDLRVILDKAPQNSTAFYRGAALQLSSRLRVLNSKINSELSSTQNSLSELIRSSNMTRHLSITKSEVERTGDTVVSKLMNVMPHLESLRKHFPDSKPVTDLLKNTIEAVFLEDAQNFDRISQQLNQIQQHFENLRRLANGSTPSPIQGDQRIFETNSK